MDFGKILESPNPSFPVGTVAATLAAGWGFEGEVSELVSTQDQNFKVRDGDGRRYVLKVSNPSATRADLELQAAAMRHVAASGAGFEAPVPIVAADGDDLVELDGHLLRLVTWVDGVPLADVGRLRPPILGELGGLAGRSLLALAAFEHPALRRSIQWEPGQALAVVAELIDAAGDERRRGLVEAAVAPLERLDVAALPRQAVHCDVTDYNVIGRRGADGLLHPVGIVDFGDVAESWRVTEAAHAAMAAVFHDLADPLGGALAVLRGCVAVVPLDEREAEAFWPLLLARAAVDAISSSHQARLVGATPHLLRLMEEDWAALEAALAVPLPLAAAAARKACGHEPAPAAAGAVAQLAAAASASLVDLGPEAPRPLDLSVASTLLEPGAWEDRAAMAGVAGGGGVAVGRWGEVRITASGAPGPAAPATLHLGVDLFLPAGTEVRAPLAATALRAGGRELVLEPASGAVEGPVRLRLAGIEPRAAAGGAVAAGEVVGCVAEGGEGILPPHVHLQITVGGELPGLICARDAAVALAVSPDPSPLLGLDAAAPGPPDHVAQLERRRAAVAAAQATYYAQPPEIVRGWRYLLFDGEGRPYVDAVNNVAMLGHSHPAVTAAATRQLRLLNTNSRFLYGAMAEYADRLLALFPDELDRVFFVNSGSEAVDLALRLARVHTGREDAIALQGAYHGWTAGAFELCTHPGDRPDWREHPSPRLHVAAQPDPYRGPSSHASPYLDSVATACAAAAEKGGLAAFISEPLLGNQGGVEPPPGYLAGAYERVRAAGGVCIADEVQVGLGRTGSAVWAFEHEEVVPDVVCVAKAAGNGYPLGAVVCRAEIAASLGAATDFFSSPAGSPVSCEVGRAVLEVFEAERLQENAARIGALLRHRLAALATEHELIGAVHGRGLFLGLDLVRDRATREPARADAVTVCERLREEGAIVQPTGDRGNVLKVKPPLCLDEEGVEVLVGGLARVLEDGL